MVVPFYYQTSADRLRLVYAATISSWGDIEPIRVARAYSRRSAAHQRAA